jgi:hypothetical protein
MAQSARRLPFGLRCPDRPPTTLANSSLTPSLALRVSSCFLMLGQRQESQTRDHQTAAMRPFIVESFAAIGPLAARTDAWLGRDG